MSIAPDVYKKIVTAKLYIDGNFNEAIDLDRISREACLSRFHFHRLFTRIYRVTPHQYLTRKRIEQARMSLAGNTLTITEICNDVGFESISSFSTLFKKEISHAPTQYRVRAWQRQEQTREQPRSELRRICLELHRSCFATLQLVRAFRSSGPVLLVRNLRCARLSRTALSRTAQATHPLKSNNREMPSDETP